MQRRRATIGGLVVAAALALPGLGVPVVARAFEGFPSKASGVVGPSTTLIGAGVADMYPVDVTQDGTSYYMVDPGRFRILKMPMSAPGDPYTVNPDGGVQGSGLGQISDARAIAIDTTSTGGLLYVADSANNRIESFDPATLAYKGQFGSAGKGDGQFKLAYGVAVGPGDDNGVSATVIYAADGGGRVEKFDLTGAYLGDFGCASTAYTGCVVTSSAARLTQPRQIAVDPFTDDVYVTDGGTRQIAVFDDHGNYITRIGGGSGIGPGQFSSDPHGIAISADGTTLYASDAGATTMRVEAFSLQPGTGYGTYIGSVGVPAPNKGAPATGEFVGLRGLTATPDGHLLVTDQWGFGFVQLLPVFTGGMLTGYTGWQRFYGAPPPVPGVNSPRGVHVDPNSGAVIVMDYWNQRVESVAPDGSQAVVFGYRGQRTTKGAINFAWDFAIQPVTGDIFVANRESQNIEVFCGTQITSLCQPGTTTGCKSTAANCLGSFITQWGKKGSGAGDLLYPQGIAFAPDGTLLVADSGNDRIEQFSIDSTGTGTYLAQYGFKGLAGGKQPTPGGLNQPTGLSVDAGSGTVWIADTLNNDVQSFSLATGFFNTPIGFKTVKVPWGVTFGPDGNVWVADTGHGAIVKLSTTGTLLEPPITAAAAGVTPAFNGISSIAFGTAVSGGWNVYVGDTWNNRVLALQIS